MPKNSINIVNSNQDKYIYNRTYHKQFLNSKDKILLNVASKKLHVLYYLEGRDDQEKNILPIRNSEARRKYCIFN